MWGSPLIFAVFQLSLLSLPGGGYAGYFSPRKGEENKTRHDRANRGLFPTQGRGGNGPQRMELKLSLCSSGLLPGVCTDTSRGCWDSLPTDRWGGGGGGCLSSPIRAVENISARSQPTPFLSAGVQGSVHLSLEVSPSWTSLEKSPVRGTVLVDLLHIIPGSTDFQIRTQWGGTIPKLPPLTSPWTRDSQNHGVVETEHCLLLEGSDSPSLQSL